MKNSCEIVREHAMKTINFKKEKMKLLTKEQKSHMKIQKSVRFVKKYSKINIWKIKSIAKFEIIIQGEKEALHIEYII